MEDKEYYVIYDLDDNIIALCLDLDELSEYTNRRKRELKYRFKTRNCIYYLYYVTYRKIYKFTDDIDFNFEDNQKGLVWN